MSMLSRDTTPEAARAQLAILRSLGSHGRMELWSKLCAQVRALQAAGVRRRHPDYSDEQVRLAVIKLRIGPQLFAKAYPEVEVEP